MDTSAALLIAAVLLASVVVGAWPVIHQARTRARRTTTGTQEAHIVVDHGYKPSRIELEAGVPTTLHFERREDDACTEMLVSDLWPSTHRLRAHAETEIRFTPERPGRYAFTCGMGVYSGELIVRGGRPS
ncbi:MAG TPA: cupredoxin domain-containing protein [Gaiellaceae bacterium]|nr:cupredoxin domain-containing protein [Gaiellaceae bacterium]